MQNIGKKLVVFSLIGLMQAGLGASIIEASPRVDDIQQVHRWGDHRDQQEWERIEQQRRQQERIENERHEREMKRRPHESKKQWRERQKREMDRHERALQQIRQHARDMHDRWHHR
ncbi:hypothetical protein EV210_1213 [Anaerospora hongkongensis]|uniref:Uncharacterized protein n=1 Tax=Anaerospora hongkongensis TaxID=244830 RepID=A0A4V6NG67_9FIRM|nr:hypothetical protein [Anaerospora hongkongensis]TCL32438.1 hypothetical protein EV210_1213 [Anaerospora hongkongensis]